MQPPQSSGCCGDAYFRNVITVSFAFLVLFSAFNTLQSYVTSLLPGNLGNISLGVIYVSVCLTVVFAPFIVAKCGARFSMFLGAACYTVFIASLIDIIQPVVLAASVVLGFGASILWVAVGGFLTDSSPESQRGKNTGIFWSLFMISNILGNFSAYVIFSRLSQTALFTIFTIVAAAGVLLFLLLRPLPPISSLPASQQPGAAPAGAENAYSSLSDSERQEYEAGGGDSHVQHQHQHQHHQHHQQQAPLYDDRDLLQSSSMGHGGGATSSAEAAHLVPLLKKVWKLLKGRSMLLVCPTFVWTGLELAFWNGEYTQLLDQSVIGLVMLWVGVAEVIGGTVLGRVADRFGRSLVMALGCTAYALGLAAAVAIMQKYEMFYLPFWFGAPWVAYFAAFLFGIADSAFNTCIYAHLGARFGTEGGVAAFTCLNLVQNVGSAAGFLYAIPLPMHGDNGTLWQVWLQSGAMVLALAGFLRAERDLAEERSQLLLPGSTMSSAPSSRKSSFASEASSGFSNADMPQYERDGGPEEDYEVVHASHAPAQAAHGSQRPLLDPTGDRSGGGQGLKIGAAAAAHARNGRR